MIWWPSVNNAPVSATASVSSNGTIVTVTTTADITAVPESGGLVIGSNPPVEVKRGYLDGSTKRIELVKPWPYTNQTNQSCVVYPTDFNVADEVAKLKNSGTDNANSALFLNTLSTSTANTVTLDLLNRADVTAVPVGKLNADLNTKRNAMSAIGRDLYATDRQGEALAILGEQPNVTPVPLLDLNFAENTYKVYENGILVDKTINEVLTTTRNSTATYNSPFGIGTAGINEPRITFDPNNGENLGLLAEEARTNLLLRSNAMLTSPWVVGEGCVVTEDFDNPVSDDRSYLVTGASIVGFNDPNLRVTVSNIPINTLLVFSVWVYPAANCTSISLRSNSDAQGLPPTSYIRPVTPLCWQRIDAPVARSTTACVITVSSASNNPAGAPFKVSAAQLEVGSSPTSYIQTQASQVTKTFDNITLNPPLQESGVFCVEFNLSRNTNFNTVLGVGSAAQEEIRIGFGPASANNVTATIRAGSVQTITGNNVYTVNTKSKFALCYRNTPNGVEWTGFFNGVKNNTITTTTFPIGFFTSGIRLGARRPSSNDLFWNGNVYRFTYYPYALSDEDLIDLTKL